MKYLQVLYSKFITIIIFLALSTQLAVAGMTISGTRIIFPGGEREKTVRTTNKGSLPVLVQVWVDDGSKNEDINKMQVPFTVTPPVYRVEPGKGQSIRLIYNGMNLPQDRESVFWFNLLEIPPVNEQAANSDRLELAFRTRIKIFYRPSTLKSTSAQEAGKLTWTLTSKGLRVTNPTPYYFSFDSAALNTGNGKVSLNVDMIAPMSSKEFGISSKNASTAGVNGASVNLINDYGSVLKLSLTRSQGQSMIINE